jgi:hypothetical protein
MSVPPIRAPLPIPERRAKRTFSPISSAILLAACSGGPVQEQADAGAVPIECAVGPGSELAPDCLVEANGEALVIRHPDGSFRRLIRDGDSLSSADGAGEPVMAREGETVEFTVDGDRYRWRAGQLDDR